MFKAKNSSGSLIPWAMPVLVGLVLGVVLLVVLGSVLPWSSSSNPRVAQANEDVEEPQAEIIIKKATPEVTDANSDEEYDESYTVVGAVRDKGRIVTLLSRRTVYFDNSFIYLQNDDEGVVVYDYKGGALASLFPIQMFYIGEENINQYMQSAGVTDVVNVNLAASVILIDNCGRPSADNVSLLQRFGEALRSTNDVKQAAAVYASGTAVSNDENTWDASVKAFANAVAAVYIDATDGIQNSAYYTDWSWNEGYDLCKTAITEMGGDQQVAAVMMERSVVVNQKPPEVCTPGVPLLAWPNEDRRITQWFGVGHGAIDIATTGTLRSPVNGTVINIIQPGNLTYPMEYSDSGGKVIIRPFGDEYADVQVEQWHMDIASFTVSIGDQVEEGQVIGSAALQNNNINATSYGGTYWTGPHVHFALKKAGVWVDPMPCMK